MKVWSVRHPLVCMKTESGWWPARVLVPLLGVRQIVACRFVLDDIHRVCGARLVVGWGSALGVWTSLR